MKHSDTYLLECQLLDYPNLLQIFKEFLVIESNLYMFNTQCESIKDNFDTVLVLL